MTVKSAKAPPRKVAKARTRKPATTPIRRRAIQPLGDRVLILALEVQEKLKSGIIIPDTAKERPQEGRVIEVGPGRITDKGNRIAPEIMKGDTVLYGRYSGTEIKIEGQEYLILRETDILATL